ncbi:hypothetical protein BGI42_16040 [Clostridium taeniosporum]|uniref:Uncharacterized protein n=1 Tax=Clostridium taeniosporum TaxID=394958 RepID=A0A2I6SDJ8_9CLOT|nr:hypothetical protein BGI42_16040 [Clostridium taeniosporum]
MAEEMNQAKIYFWVCIKYMYNCHVSGELQGCNEILLIFLYNSNIFISFSNRTLPVIVIL